MNSHDNVVELARNYVIEYVVDEEDNEDGSWTRVGVFNTKEEAEAAAHKLVDSYEGVPANKTIDVCRVTKKNPEDKENLLQNTTYECLLIVYMS